MHQLEQYLNSFAEECNCEVSELTPGIVSRYLTGMTASERTKKNARDVLGYFGRWLVLHGYLTRGTDLVEGVQKYSMKPGEIQNIHPGGDCQADRHADDATPALHRHWGLCRSPGSRNSTARLVLRSILPTASLK